MRQQHIFYKRNNKRFYVQFWDSDRGCYSTPVFTGQAKRGAAAGWLREATSMGEFASPRRTKVDFKAFASNFFCPDSEYIQRRQRESKRMGPGDMKNQRAKVDKSRILDYKSFMIDKGLSNQTIDQSLYALKGILEWDLAKGKIHQLPEIRFCKGYSQSKDRGVLDQEEVRTLLALQDQPRPHRLLAALAYTTGMRQGELLCLQWSKVDLEKGSLEVSTSWDRVTKAVKSTKTGRVRYIPVAPQMVTWLKDYQDHIDPENQTNYRQGEIRQDSLHSDRKVMPAHLSQRELLAAAVLLG